MPVYSSDGTGDRGGGQWYDTRFKAAGKVGWDLFKWLDVARDTLLLRCRENKTREEVEHDGKVHGEYRNKIRRSG